MGLHSRAIWQLERAVVISSGLDRWSSVDVALSSGGQEEFVARSFAALAGTSSRD